MANMSSRYNLLVQLLRREVIQRITGVAERAPVIDEKTSTELAITIDNLTLGGFKPDGVTTIPQSSCIGDGNGPERLL